MSYCDETDTKKTDIVLVCSMKHEHVHKGSNCVVHFLGMFLVLVNQLLGRVPLLPYSSDRVLKSFDLDLELNLEEVFKHLYEHSSLK